MVRLALLKKSCFVLPSWHCKYTLWAYGNDISKPSFLKRYVYTNNKKSARFKVAIHQNAFQITSIAYYVKYNLQSTEQIMEREVLWCLMIAPTVFHRKRTHISKEIQPEYTATHRDLFWNLNLTGETDTGERKHNKGGENSMVVQQTDVQNTTCILQFNSDGTMNCKLEKWPKT